MKISKAIEILTYWETDLDAWNEADTDTAIKLGIEALEKVQKYRHTTMPVQALIFEGETPEDEEG